MLEKAFTRPATIRRYRSSYFGPYLDDFVAFLVGQGYPRSTVHTKVNRVNALGRWLARNDLTVGEIQSGDVEAFLADWRRQGRFFPGDAGTVLGFLGHLRANGVVTVDDVCEASAPTGVVAEYERYLTAERGLRPRTIANYLYFTRQFVADIAGQAPPPTLDAIGPRHVSRFMLGFLQASNHSHTKNMAKVLRSFLRFLFLAGKTRKDLSESVPKVPSARLADIPKYISLDEVQRVLGSCDLNTAIGRRDHVILLLLVRLGLRAREVVDLTLEDIDWAAAELVIHGKGRQRHRLPLLFDVGQALASYIRHDRPQCDSRSVFIRQKAPFRGLGDSAAVSWVARQALKRADVSCARKGAHVFRHSLATGLLHRGVSLTEIGDVLRHRSIHATEVYAKVDLNGLRSLARPWPLTGGAK